MNYTPQHAEKALEIIVDLIPRISPRPEYSELVAILQEPSRWKEAHAHFNKIRVNITLPSEAHRKKTLDDYFTYVAENAAKTAYNCSGESGPFDNDSFDRLLRCKEQFEDYESKSA
jgi:hypothetical protein